MALAIAVGTLVSDWAGTKFFGLKKETIMSATERMEWLTEVIRGNIKEIATTYVKQDDGSVEKIEKEFMSKLDTKLKALDTLNKMSGEYRTILDGSVNHVVKLEDVLNDS